MKIGVCIKAVPETSQILKVSQDGRTILRNGLNYIINPFDEAALEEALKIKDKRQDTEVILYTVGCNDSIKIIKQALSTGADRAVLVTDNREFLDGFTAAMLLKEVIQIDNPDLIFMGKQAIDNNAHEVVSLLGSLMNRRHFTDIIHFELNEESVVVQRDLDHSVKIQTKVNLPCICGFTRGINRLRFPSLLGIINASEKEIKIISSTEIYLENDSPIIFENYEAPENIKTVCRFLKGSQEDVVCELLKILIYDEKIITI